VVDKDILDADAAEDNGNGRSRIPAGSRWRP